MDRILSLVIPQEARYSMLLMGVNLVLFGLTLAASAQRREGEFDFGSLLGSIDSYTLVRFGAKYGPLLAAGEWWRFLTPIFLHGSLIHLAFNSMVLFDLGPAVEQIYGSQKFFVLYVLTGAAGFVLSNMWHPYSVSIGASGSLFGLIGAMIAYGYRNRRALGNTVKSMYVRWAIYGLIFGFFFPGIDNSAHIGGLIAGLLFGLLVSDMPSVTRESIFAWKALRTIVVLLVIFGFVMVGLHQPR
jgi:rhomboid protease GluP